MTSIIKTGISLVLSVVLFTGGYFGTKQALTGGESPGLRDNTGYTPVSFSWSGMENRDMENSRFLAGKYLRNDGNAVLYIDYEQGSYGDYFLFELFVMETREGRGLGADGIAYIDGGAAIYFEQYMGDDYIFFENIREGVIEVEADLYDTPGVADGTYYIVNAKYVETPNPAAINDTSKSSGGGGTGGGGAQDPQFPGDPPDGGSIGDMPEQPQDGTRVLSDNVPEDPAGSGPQIYADGPGATDKDATPENRQEHDQFEKVNDVRKDPPDNSGIGEYLQGKHVKLEGTSTVRWDWIYDKGKYRQWFRARGSEEDSIDALIRHTERGGWIGESVKTNAEFVFGTEILAQYVVAKGRTHDVGDYLMGKNSFLLSGFIFPGKPVAIRDIEWNSKEGHLRATFYEQCDYDDPDTMTISVSLLFGRDANGDIIARGWGFGFDGATSRVTYDIELKGKVVTD